MSSSPSRHVSTRQHLSIPFSVPRRHQCSVSVTVEPVRDPDRHGHPLLGIYEDPASTQGFPVIQATISSPSSQTYASIYGWVQIFHTPAEGWMMDMYPLFEGVNSPYLFWGAEPTLVDAATRPPMLEQLDWTARSFLCYSPDAAMTKHVVPILALEWGFWIEGHKPYVKKLQQLDTACWNEHLELFRRNYDGWTFDPVAQLGVVDV